MGKSRKTRQRTSKDSTETGSWLLPALTTTVSGMRKKCRGTLVDMPSVSHDPIYMNVLVQSVALATTYTKKQACPKSFVKASKALFLKSAVAAVQSPAGDISYVLKFFRQYVGLQVQEDCIDLVM